jgi:hypothetical protein
MNKTGLSPSSTNKREKVYKFQMKCLNHATNEADNILKEINKTDEVNNYIYILEEFIRKNRIICYGGTAINNILPKESQFYKKNDIADYDMYSVTPMEHAQELADHYYSLGYKETTASAGSHPGTFKVYVNFIAIADFTFLSPRIFSKLEKEAIIIEGISYCSPNFLRMNMMEELAHPLNQPERFEKVFLRFQLMNIFYPMNLMYPMNTTNHNPMLENNKPRVQSKQLFMHTLVALLEQNVVFLGEFAFYVFFKKIHGYIPAEFDVLCEDPITVAAFIKARLASTVADASTISISRILVPEGDTKYANVEIHVGKHRWVTLWIPPSAINYNELPLSGCIHGITGEGLVHRNIRVASPETMILYFSYFYYLERRPNCCMKVIKELLDKYFSMENEGAWKHFSVLSYGKPSNLRDIKKFKSQKYKELKCYENSKEYKWLFLKYEPGADTSDHCEKKRPSPPRSKKTRRIRRGSRRRSR